MSNFLEQELRFGLDLGPLAIFGPIMNKFEVTLFMFSWQKKDENCTVRPKQLLSPRNSSIMTLAVDLFSLGVCVMSHETLTMLGFVENLVVVPC